MKRSRPEFDFVVVGGGSAGCVLAARLSEDPAASVCLLEAGPRDSHPLIRVPMGMLWLMRSPGLNWRYRTLAQRELAGRALYCPRGRTLGGSSAINAMIYTRGHRCDYDGWRDSGNPGWSYAEVLPYFRRAENQERGASEYHGGGGPLNVADPRSPNALSLAFLDAALQAGYRANPDFNGAEQEGVGLYQLTQANGVRVSTAHAYLRPAQSRPNLTVITGAHATRIVLERGRAAGVEYLKDGRRETAGARAEVLLSAGAINTPQLLMLSGIGPADELARHGIAVALDAPGVGANLQDHLDVIVVQACVRPVSYGLTPLNLLKTLPEALRFLVARTGMLTTNGAEAGGFVRSGADRDAPDLQFHFTPIRLRNHALDIAFMIGHGYSLHVCDLRPASRGRIALAGPDPVAPPRIDPCYLSDPADMEALVRGVKAARRVLDQRAFDPYRGAEILPGERTRSDEDIRAFIRQRAESIYHPVGIPSMGADATAVVDARLRVRGVEGLRAVDASIMPALVGGNTNAPVVMIAEKAADMIREDYRR